MVTVNGDASKRMVVRPGERIRLRLVNTSNGRVYRPDFGALSTKVLAVDGMYTARPLDLDGFDLAPGNRLHLDIQVPAGSVQKCTLKGVSSALQRDGITA